MFKQSLNDKVLFDNISEKTLALQVLLDDYREKMNPEGKFLMKVTATNLYTGRTHVNEANVDLGEPDIVIEVRWYKAMKGN